MLGILWSHGISQETETDNIELKMEPVRHFGFELFDRATTTMDTTIGSVDGSYPIGPGDEIVITIWGDMERFYSTRVSREGMITIPSIGPLSVNGVRLEELETRIRQVLGSAYSSIRGVNGDPTTFVDVSLGKLRTVQVWVVGEVLRSGSLLLSSTSTIVDALYKAGGILESGSLRHIKLIRQHEELHEFDFYEFLLEGSKSGDIRLQNGDVIKVIPGGKRITLQGEVFRPAIYELRRNEGLRRLLYIAGGLNVKAYTEHLQIERVIGHRERKILDVNLKKILDSGDDFLLEDGDKISIFSISQKILNSVHTSGYVKRPGRYQLAPGMRIRDLILKSGGLFPEAYLGRSTLVRTNPDLTKESISFNLGLALSEDPSHNLPLTPLDDLTVYSIHTFEDPQFVSIQGQVRSPGRYELVGNMSLKDLIVLAGGLTDLAHKLEAEVARFDPEAATLDQPVSILSQPIDDFYEVQEVQSNANGRHLLKNRDAVFIRPNPNFEEGLFVTVRGEVRFPGTYALRNRNERLTDIVIGRAGGLKPSANPRGLRLDRQEIGVIPVNFSKAMEAPGGSDDLVLEHNDTITIAATSTIVHVAGEVLKPGNVLYRNGKGLDYYIARTGGPTREADVGRAYVIHANGEVRSSHRLLLLWRSHPKVEIGSRIVVPGKS